MLINLIVVIIKSSHCISFLKNNYLLLAALCLCCGVWAFSSCHEQGLLFIVVHGLLIAVASLFVEHGL